MISRFHFFFSKTAAEAVLCCAMPLLLLRSPDTLLHSKKIKYLHSYGLVLAEEQGNETFY